MAFVTAVGRFIRFIPKGLQRISQGRFVEEFVKEARNTVTARPSLTQHLAESFLHEGSEVGGQDAPLPFSFKQ